MKDPVRGRAHPDHPTLFIQDPPPDATASTDQPPIYTDQEAMVWATVYAEAAAKPKPALSWEEEGAAGAFKGLYDRQQAGEKLGMIEAAAANLHRPLSTPAALATQAVKDFRESMEAET